ncbi:MAG: MFS transporter [Acidobacteria bacterium]|nr:MFS transporter [Acidobacteriota bacterium]
MASNHFKLSVMMFLEFFIWGAWFPLVFGYLPSLGFSGAQQAWILGAFNLAALVALFFSTQFADRHFAAEKFLAFSQLIGGCAILALFWVKGGWKTELAGVPVDLSFWTFFGLMLVHALLYVPTISITNSIAFAHLRDPQKEFGPVRLWGTIGWIAAAWPFTFILIDWPKVPEFGSIGFVDWLGQALGTSKTEAALREATSYTFVAAGIASFLLAAFSLVLPHTPPRPAQEGSEKLAWLEAVRLLRHPFVFVLFVVTFFDAAVHQIYFSWAGRFLEQGVKIPGNWVMPIMSIGQVAEIVTMAFLGVCLAKLGWRYTMVIGILGHAARFAVFAFAPQPVPAITVNVLHGICYAFFFATVYIFVDEFFPKDARSSAQGLFNFLILGAGPFVGNFLGVWLGQRFQLSPAVVEGGVEVSPAVIDFQSLFLVPSGIAMGAALILLLFFHPPDKREH